MNKLPISEKPPFATDRDFFLGVDPGGSGGLCVLDRRGAIIDASPMPETERDISDYLGEFGPRIRMAVIEHVHAMPKQGVSSSFKFGMSYGALVMGLVAHGIAFERVTPQGWQKVMGCTVAGRGLSDDKTGKKNANKAKAQELFPGRKITHAIADAMLLAEYVRRRYVSVTINEVRTSSSEPFAPLRITEV